MNPISKHYRVLLCCIPIFSFALHYHVFNLDLVGIHVWRQTETQTVIDNFYKEDFNILHPRVNGPADTDRLHLMEFPLMQWVFAAFYKVFGGYIVVSRGLTFIIGLVSVYGMFYLSDQLFKNKAIATICAWCFNWSPVFYYYTVNPMPDNMALCCGIWSIGLFYKYTDTVKTRYALWSAMMLCIAALVKLPFILYGAYVIPYLIKQLRRSPRHILWLYITYILLAIPVAVWYLYAIPHWKTGVTRGLLDARQSKAELLHILVGNFVSILPELLINYGSVFFFVAGFWFLFREGKQKSSKFLPLLIWGITILFYFIFEANMIDTVHDYYLFPFLPLIFLIVSYGAYRLLAGNIKLLRGLTTLCLLVLPLTAFLRIDSRWDVKEPGFNVVYYNYKYELRNLIPRDALCIVGNDPSGYILLYYADRKGWAYDKDMLNEQSLKYDIGKGATYLYTDGDITDNISIKAHLGEMVFNRAGLKIYKLKRIVTAN